MAGTHLTGTLHARRQGAAGGGWDTELGVGDVARGLPPDTGAPRPAQESPVGRVLGREWRQARVLPANTVGHTPTLWSQLEAHAVLQRPVLKTVPQPRAIASSSWTHARFIEFSLNA